MSWPVVLLIIAAGVNLTLGMYHAVEAAMRGSFLSGVASTVHTVAAVCWLLVAFSLIENALRGAHI